MRASMGSAAMAGPANCTACPVPPLAPTREIRFSTMSLAYTCGGSVPWKFTRIGPGPGLHQHLRGQHMLALGRADAPGQHAQAAQRTGVAIRADDGQARQRDAQLRRNHMRNALPRILDIDEV